jgi:hypothetical protein
MQEIPHEESAQWMLPPALEGTVGLQSVTPEILWLTLIMWNPIAFEPIDQETKPDWYHVLSITCRASIPCRTGRTRLLMRIRPYWKHCMVIYTQIVLLMSHPFCLRLEQRVKLSQALLWSSWRWDSHFDCQSSTLHPCSRRQPNLW